MSDDRLRIAAIVDVPEHLGFFSRLARILEGTGEVEATLLICHDRTPDGDGAIPSYRIRERSLRAPAGAYDWADITGYERWLIEVYDYFRGRYADAAASICAEAEQWFDDHPVDCALVWAGTRLAARAMAAAARGRGVPVIFLESPYFPVTPDSPPDGPSLSLHRMTMRTLIWDVMQAPQCGPSQITAEWSAHPVAAGLHQFIAALHASRQSKFSATDIGRFIAGGARAGPPPEPAPDLARPAGAKVLLACGQLNKDSSMFFGRHLVRRWQDMVLETAARLPPGWAMWFKAHPLDIDYLAEAEQFEAEVQARQPACRSLPPAMNIHDAIAAADAVLCINSNVGLEATTYDKPVITLGEGYYTDKGFTHPAPSLDALGDLIAGLPATMSGEHKAIRDRFLSYLLYRYLLPVGRPERALERIRQAMGARGPRPQPEQTPEERLRRLAAQLEGYRRCVYDLENALAREIDARGVVETQRDYFQREGERWAREAERWSREAAHWAPEADHWSREADRCSREADRWAHEAERWAREAGRYETELRAVTSRRLYRLTEVMARALRRLRRR